MLKGGPGVLFWKCLTTGFKICMLTKFGVNLCLRVVCDVAYAKMTVFDAKKRFSQKIANPPDPDRVEFSTLTNYSFKFLDSAKFSDTLMCVCIRGWCKSLMSTWWERGVRKGAKHTFCQKTTSQDHCKLKLSQQTNQLYQENHKSTHSMKPLIQPLTRHPISGI